MCMSSFNKPRIMNFVFKKFYRRQNIGWMILALFSPNPVGSLQRTNNVLAIWQWIIFHFFTSFTLEISIWCWMYLVNNKFFFNFKKKQNEWILWDFFFILYTQILQQSTNYDIKFLIKITKIKVKFENILNKQVIVTNEYGLDSNFLLFFCSTNYDDGDNHCCQWCRIVKITQIIRCCCIWTKV